LTKSTEEVILASDEDREEEVVTIDQDIAELVPGVLFIDEIYMLDIEFFTFLNVTATSSAISWSIHRGKCYEVRSANQGRVKEKNKDITWSIWMKLYFSLSDKY